MSNGASHEQFERLLVKAVDGRLTPREQGELETHLAHCASCRAELEDFRLIKHATDAIARQAAPGAARVLARRRPPITGAAQVQARRRPLTIGAAVGVGSMLAVALVLLSYGVYGIMVERSIPLHVKAGGGFVGVGMLLALGFALRNR